MAQVALLTKGIVYDTSRQVGTLHQVVERFMLGDSLCEKCIVTEIMFDEHDGYTYTLMAIFTDEPADVLVLERIKAKRNSSLTYQGRKVAGWIFPKYRQAQLAAVMSL